MTDPIFFIGFGGPDKKEDIMPFLETVTRGRGIPRERLLDVAHHYEVIGGKSPINEITNRQAAALAKESGRKTYVGNRNWHPFIEETLKKMAADGVTQATGFVTAAYRCEASWERYLNAVAEARMRVGGSAPIINYVEPWFDHPLFIEAIVARIQEVFAHTPTRSPAEPIPWVFTAHSIPTPMAQDSRYVQELERTAGLVAEKFGRKEWRLAYSSRSGRPQDPWLEPDVCDVIREEAASGCKDMLVIPIGFIADHVEVLFDLDVEAQEAAKETGVRLLRAKTVGDHPTFVRMMADITANAVKCRT